MERKEKAKKSASDIATIAGFIASALTLDFPPEQLKGILAVPMKQLEEELETLRIYVRAIK